MNGFEKYIKENSDNQESIEVNPEIWASIQAELYKKHPGHNIQTWIRIAATLLVVTASIVLLRYLLDRGSGLNA